MDCQTPSGSGSLTQSVLEPELYFLIARFLSAGPCKETSKILLEELEKFKLLPRRVDWEGNDHFRSYENLVYLNRHIRSDHLLRIVERVGTLVDKEVKSNVPGVKSLLGAGSLSILRTVEGLAHTKWESAHHVIKHHGASLYPPTNLLPPPVPHVLQGYQMSGSVCLSNILPSCTYNKISMHGRKLGHLSAVYCVLFDRTGNYIFTGADDALVKIWSTFDMRLLATLRGHDKEITDMAVSFENTYLASGSCDKVVRVWCLKSKAPTAVLQGHMSLITSVQFCPMVNGDHRYLVSTGNDGCVCFWYYNISTNVFNPKPIKFIEKSRAGAQMLCSSFSPGGAFLATGNSDSVIRVYFLHHSGVPEKICELESHTDKVDSICYSNHHNRFISGSNDGTARIWRFENHQWRATILNMAAKIDKSSPSFSISPQSSSTDQLRVTMVSWSVDDQKVMTAASDRTIKVWGAFSGVLLQVLEGHEDEVYVLEACPADSRILLSAGHDGKLIIWDINTGSKIKKFFNLIEGQGHGAFFDCKFSPDGLSIAATDSHGHMLLLGFGTNERCKKLPQQLFFHTDYRPLMRDSNNYVLDEQTQQPPHLMAPPFLVDIDGVPYPASIQRCVPGREYAKESSLIPQMAVNEEGDAEVIGERDEVVPLDVAQEEDGSDTDVEGQNAALEAASVRQINASGSRVRPSIDAMIEELQREQDRQIGETGPNGVAGSSGESRSRSPAFNTFDPRSPMPMVSPPTPRSSMQIRIGMRRSGEIEGVRLQSLGNVSMRSTKKERDAWRNRVIVKPLDGTALQLSEQRRLAFSEDEVKRFITERKNVFAYENKRLPPKKGVGRRNTRVQVSENVETARNRLTARALYDTDEEDDEREESDIDLNASDSNNSSDDYSDWVGDQGSSNLEPPQRRSRRIVKRRRFVSTDDDEEEEDDDVDVDDELTEVEGNSSNEDSSAGVNDNVDKQSDDNEDATTSGIQQLATTGTPKLPERRTHKGRKMKGKTKKPDSIVDIAPITELNEAMRPSEWITTTIPRKAPFVPQMGDEVMYFRQGHLQYLQAVIRKEVYTVDIDKNQPWHKHPQLKVHELVKIVGIKWLLKPARLCCLKLRFIDNTSGKLSSKSFTIKYHDMPDVIDFLVLKQHYDISVDRKWKPGTKFRSMIDDQWWNGIITSQEPLHGDFPDSLYQCFCVHWDNGEFERLSPWDMEPVDSKRQPAQVGGGIDVTPEEYKQLLYVPKKTEWTSLGREAESARLITGLGVLMQHSFAEPFITPVDLQQFPTYAMCVAYPMDLSTIKARIENGFYRRVTALQWDVRLIHANAIVFNEPHSTIVRNANVLTEALLRFIKDHDCSDPLPLLTELSRTGVGTTSSDDASQSNSPKKRLAAASRKKSNPDAWVEQSESLLATLFDCEDSTPFRIPVDPMQLPDYEDVVSEPMDLTTVHSKLATRHYGNPLDLCKDLRLIFSNSKLYNTNKRSRIYTMTLRLSALFEDQIAKIIKRWKSALQASGRLNRLSKQRGHPRSDDRNNPISLSTRSWGQYVESKKPSTSRSSFGASSSQSKHSNGHKPGPAAVSDDSDATIVDDVHASDDGVETEVYEEEVSSRKSNHSSKMNDGSEDSDYQPSAFVLKKIDSPIKAKGKGKLKRGKGKSSNQVPPRISNRPRKPNIFYASDNNDDDDDDDDDDDNNNFQAAILASKSSRLHKDTIEKTNDCLNHDKSGKPPSHPNTCLNKGKSAVRSHSTHIQNSPAHRKSRSARSKKCYSSSDDDKEGDIDSQQTSYQHSHSSLSGRSHKYYADKNVDVEEEEGSNRDSDEDSSSEFDSDSEDEVITQALLNKKRLKQSKSKPRKRIKLPSDSDNSHSDSIVPPKRVRLQTPQNSSCEEDYLGSQRGRRKKRLTRNKGCQRVKYIEDYSEEDEGGIGGRYSNNSSGKECDDDDNVQNVSSRGRVRKLTAKAKSFSKTL